MLLNTFNSNMTSRPSNGNSRCEYRPNLPHNNRLLLLRILCSYAPEIYPLLPIRPASTPEIQPPHNLALSLNDNSLLLPLSLLQPHQPSISDPFLPHSTRKSTILVQNRLRQQRRPPRPRHLSRLLDDQFLRYERVRPYL